MVQVSFMSYETQLIKNIKIEENQTTPLNVTLKEGSQQLKEVVVVGFGTQNKVNLTGAIGVATAETFQERPVMTATQALQGVVPEWNISQRNGDMDSRPEMNIRGFTTIGEGSNGSPLILVDGMSSNNKCN